VQSAPSQALSMHAVVRPSYAGPMAKRGRRSGNPGARPTSHGLPVPWVTQWTAETALPLKRPRVEDSPGPDGESVPTLVCDNDSQMRDRHGILWMHLSARIGSGQAQFAQLHPIRQRRAIDERRCQICGQRISGQLTFLLPDSWLGAPTVETFHPPVCERCAPMAMRLCPHVHGNTFQLVAVEQSMPVAVVGDIYNLMTGAREQTIIARHDDPRSRLLIARQRITALSGLRPVGR
jgi:hypothetical protein